MARLPRVGHVVTTEGGKKIGLKLPDVYANISNLTGVAKSTGAETGVTKGGSMIDLARHGHISVVRCTYIKTAATNTTPAKKGSITLAVDIEKAEGAVQALPGAKLKINGAEKEILTASIRRRRHLG
jgi:hypothetical protein